MGRSIRKNLATSPTIAIDGRAGRQHEAVCAVDQKLLTMHFGAGASGRELGTAPKRSARLFWGSPSAAGIFWTKPTSGQLAPARAGAWRTIFASPVRIAGQPPLYPWLKHLSSPTLDCDGNTACKLLATVVHPRPDGRAHSVKEWLVRDGGSSAPNRARLLQQVSDSPLKEHRMPANTVSPNQAFRA